MIVLPSPAVKLAEQQLGVIARFQLRRWLTTRQIDGLVSRGFLCRLERGGYRVAGGAKLPEQRAFAAALRTRPNATITGPFVLGFLRVDGFSPEDDFEVLLAPNRRVQGVDFRVRPDPRPQRAVIKQGDIRLAAPLDALIDTARWRSEIGERRLRLAYDWLRWNGRIDTARASRRLTTSAASDPGAKALLEVLGGVDRLASESDGERRLGELLGRFTPPPEPQVWVTPRRRMDWYFRQVRYGFEYLGNLDHTTVAERLRDADRDEELHDAGVAVGYLTAADLADPKALLATVAGSLTVRAHRLGTTPPTLRGG